MKNRGNMEKIWYYAEAGMQQGPVDFDELRARIAKTIAFVESLSPEKFDGSEQRPIALRVGGKDWSFTGQDYLLGFALPNFHFHLVTAYNILRHNGIEIGKADYLGNP